MKEKFKEVKLKDENSLKFIQFNDLKSIKTTLRLWLILAIKRLASVCLKCWWIAPQPIEKCDKKIILIVPDEIEMMGGSGVVCDAKVVCIIIQEKFSISHSIFLCKTDAEFGITIMASLRMKDEA